MSTAAYYRALSWICVLAIISFLGWITIAPNGFPGAPVVAFLAGGATLAALRLGGRNSTPFLESAAEPTQAPRVAWIIIASLALQTVALAVVTWLPQLAWISYRAVSDLVWTGVLLTSLGIGYVKWPKRVGAPSMKTLLVVAAVAVVAATGISLMFAASAAASGSAPSATRFAITVPAVFYGSLLEEVFFRVLLLTALIQVARSSGHALILSSVAFALAHVPGAFAQPILEMDQEFLVRVLDTYAPQFTWQLGTGFALGALWIRTGSISLIAITHTILNLGSAWLSGA